MAIKIQLYQNCYKLNTPFFSASGILSSKIELIIVFIDTNNPLDRFAM